MIDCGTIPPQCGRRAEGLRAVGAQITRRVNSTAMVAGLADWELFRATADGVGMASRMAQNGARPPMKSGAKAAGSRAAAWSAATPAASPPGRRCAICNKC